MSDVGDAVDDDNEETVNRYIISFNKGDVQAVEAFLHPSYTDRVSGVGVDEALLGYRSARQAYPDLKAEIQGLAAEGNAVTVRYTVKGTPGAHLGPGAVRVEITGEEVLRFHEGRILERSGSYEPGGTAIISSPGVGGPESFGPPLPGPPGLPPLPRPWPARPGGSSGTA